MKLNEILLKDELEARKQQRYRRLPKRAEQRNRIDSLRALTPGVPVVVEGDTLFHLYAKRGGRTPVDRAEDILNIMVKIGTSHSLKKDSIYIYDSEYVTDIMYGDKVILSITDQDALWQNLSRIALAEQYQPIIQNKIQELREQHSILQIAKRVLLFILVIIIQYFLFKLTNHLFKKLRRKIIWLKQNRLRSITIRDYEFLNTHRQGRVLMFFTNVIRWIVLLIQLTISVPILFAIFPQTEDLALKIFSYLLEPVKMIFKSVASYIPNLFIILVIYYCIKYIVKGIQYIANEIESENLKISGFYPDWAQPTFNIIRFLLYAFMIAMIYPYLPGSDSGVFQGISVFVGLIITNCILMGRLEAFALGNGPWESFLDGIGNGLGYAIILIIVGFFRELLGSGTLLGFQVIPQAFYDLGYVNNGLMILPPMALIVIAVIIWVHRAKNKELQEN